MSEDHGYEVVLKQIGVVRSPVAYGKVMPVEGVPARVEVLPQYAYGLKGIESNTHLIILGWFHLAKRDTLQSSRHGAPLRGVFGLRSPSRPNPLGLSIARVTAIKDRELYLDRLDMIDSTPIMDIKRYSPGWDSVFSARTSRDLVYPEGRDPAVALQDLMLEAVNFHGESCVGAALGARIIYYAMTDWRIGKKEPRMAVEWGDDGCITDALQALSGATIGNGRLKPGVRPGYRISYREYTLTFVKKGSLPNTATGVLESDIQHLFQVRRSSRGNDPTPGARR